MIRSQRIARLLSLLLALAVVFTPVTSAFAMVVQSGNEQGTQAAHDCDHQTDGAKADHHSTSCTQHDFCAGQCCAGCAHFVGVVSLFQPAYVYSHPVQTPVLSPLHSLVLIASLDRPPRSFSC